MNAQDNIGQRRFRFREDILIAGLTQCTTANISEGGLFISAIHHFEKDDVFELSIPMKGEKMTIKAQVRHCQPGIGAGVSFIDLNDYQRARIKELIESIAKG